MTRPGTMVLFGTVIGVLAVAVGGCQPGAVQAEPNPAALSKVIYPAKASLFALTDKNFVTDWLVLGPFRFDAAAFKGDQQQDATDHEFVKDEAALDGTQAAPEGTKWQAKHFKPGPKGDAGQIDLNALYGDPEYAVAYAVAWVDCPQAMEDLKLCVGSDDYVKVWINGKCVHTYKTKRRASDWDQDVIGNISLDKGPNRIVVKCVDIVVDWDFYLRFTDEKGKAMEFQPPAPAM